MAVSRQSATAKDTNVDRSVPDIMPNEGFDDAEVVVVCDTPTIASWKAQSPIGGASFSLFQEFALKYGFSKDDFAFVSPCAPMPDITKGSAKRENAFVDQYREALMSTLACYRHAKLFIYMGKVAGYAFTGKACAIMKQRGVAREVAVAGAPVPRLCLPMLSPNHVLTRPEVKDLFEADFNMLRSIRENAYSIDAVSQEMQDVQYEWRTDISDLLENPPPGLSLDTETAKRADVSYYVKPTQWYRPEIVPLTVQMSWQPGKAIVCPVDRDFWPEMSQDELDRLVSQIKEIAENPDIKKFGHNNKFDHHIMRKLGIEVQGWAGDTMLYAFFADENMYEKGQDECVRRWVPAMAGYADAFNRKYNKDDMRSVPRDDFLYYAGGDTDANWRLAKRLVDIVREDRKQWNCCQRIQWPANKAFAEIVEPQGLLIDTPALREFHTELGATSARLYKELIREVPGGIKRRHMEKGLEFSRPDFIRDILFSKQGFNLKPVVFTESTRKLPPEERIPSTSAKEHLPFFDDNEWVVKYIEFSKVSKLQNTYVGVENGPHGPSGFWQYLWENRIHPSYLLHRTVTGRTASASPNGQNIPKHGDLAKAYRKIFIPTPGYTFIECDLSQAELRLVAWMANEDTMLDIYQKGGDIHAMTAAMIMGITLDAFMLLPKEVKKKKRQEAKAVNFGLIYGMGWKKLIVYAKTTYNVVFSEKEAQRIRDLYFRTYRKLESWHKGMRNFVGEHSYVRSMHGALRHLPNIKSIDEMIKGESERQAINSPIPRFGSEIGITAMHRICRDAPFELLRPVAFIHDALILECRNDYLEQGMAATKFYMESFPFRPWFGIRPPLPITADVSVGLNLSAMEEQTAVVSQAPDWWQMDADGFETEEEAYEYATVRA